jgi:hypothetical protein
VRCQGPLYLAEELGGNSTYPFMLNRHVGDKSSYSLSTKCGSLDEKNMIVSSVWDTDLGNESLSISFSSIKSY